jgi:uncharacterized protein YutD
LDCEFCCAYKIIIRIDKSKIMAKSKSKYQKDPLYRTSGDMRLINAR